MSGASGGFLTRVVPHGTVWLFTDEAQTVSEAAASFDWGEIQSINVHGVWIMNWAGGLRAMGEIGVRILWSQPSVHQGDLPSYLPLETEVGGFLIPSCDGGGDVVHRLDSLHNPNGDSGQEVGDESGGVFDLIVFSIDNI